MVLYDVVKQSVHDRAYRHYARGPGASPPPSVRGQYGQPGPLPAVPVAGPRAEGAGLWDDWSAAVRTAAAPAAVAVAARL